MRQFLLLPVVIAACDAVEAPEADLGESSLVYGTDDRRDVYQLTDANLRALAASSVGLVNRRDLSQNSDGTWTLASSGTLRQTSGVCSSEPYATQPTAPSCSGFQVGTDLIATAGHCVSSSNCSSTRFVFGFEMSSSSSARTRLAANDVYSCAQIVGRESSGTRDWAVVRVDRPIVGHDPLPIRRSGTVASGTGLVLVGHPMGLPTKVAGGATVRENTSSSWFGANLDAYGGNSGSAVVNAATLEVEGILVRGNTDLDWAGGCYVSNRCNDTGCPGFEEATRASLMTGVVPELVVEADFDLEGPATAVAGDAVTFTVTGAPAGATVWFVTGNKNGTTDVPGCPGLLVEQGNAYALGSAVADASGAASATVITKTTWAGKAREFSAGVLSDCMVSDVATVQF